MADIKPPSKEEIEKYIQQVEDFRLIPYQIEKDFTPIFNRLMLLMSENRIPLKPIGEMTIKEVREALKNGF